MIATVGRPERLAEIVDAALADPASLELIVVVDGPDTDSITALERLAATRPRLKFMSVPKGGQLAALDEGVRTATNDVVVLLDDDVIPGPNTITGHARQHLAATNLVVLGPMPVDLSRAGRNAATRLYAVEYQAHIDALTSTGRDALDPLWAGNMSIRRSDCMRVGLRTDVYVFHYHQDQELGYRLIDAGLTGIFDPALVAEHLHHRGDAAFLRDARRAGASQAVLHEARPEQLGPFTADTLIADLPRPLQTLVKAVASTPPADRSAALLMSVGRVMARAGLYDAELVTAKLARRVMMYRGAAAGEG